uniref:Translocon-associated protein subunit delta n=1 Tax=Astyanax mexicanus TaxID=7994 RepID=A0A8B9J619_ASTMX
MYFSIFALTKKRKDKTKLKIFIGCLDPVLTPSTYTTNDAVISSESVFIVELSLACANGVQSVALYADVNGRQFPVTRGQDVGKFQVSWSLPHKQASSGTYQVKFFDEESYSALRKVGWHSLSYTLLLGDLMPYTTAAIIQAV